MSRPSALHKRVQHAWHLRFRQRNAEAEAQLRDLKPSDADPALALEIELLRASLARARGDLMGAIRQVQAVREKSEREGLPFSFQCHFQRALNSFAQDEYAVALEYFLLARQCTHLEEEHQLCLMNVVTCLDNLNLPWESTLQELESLSRRLADSPFAAAVDRQLKTLKQHHAFREGRMSAFFALDLPAELSQAHYHRLWVSRLHFVESRASQAEVWLNQIATSEGLHGRQYRLSTLLADPRVTGPSSFVETPQQVDRLYLWTWNWLRNPGVAERERLSECLRAFDFEGALKRMTFEDFQMVRNALSWIALFQEPLRPWIERYLARFSSTDCLPFPIFEFERLWNTVLREELKGLTSNSRAKLHAHPLYASREIRFLAIAERWRGEFAALRARPTTKGALVIDTVTQRLSVRGKSMLAPTLVPVLASLSERGSLSFAEALWLGFGIAPYDAGIHCAKIQNLLVRAKSVLPRGVKLRSKQQCIYWEGRRDLVHRVAPHPLEHPLGEGLLGLSAPSSARVFERPLHPRLVVERAGGRHILAREEIQELMTLSKATTVRWLQKWQAQGLIQRRGVGRAAKYHIEIAQNYRFSSIE